VSTSSSSSFENGQNEHTAETESQEVSTPPPSAEQDQSEQEPATYPASTFPQETQDEETHGGPLGCCLGVVVGLFLTMLVLVGISILLSNGAFLGAATLPVVLLGGAVCGYLGWRIGQRVYRVYEPPVVIDKRIRKNRSYTRKTRSDG
jgi:hypothetical protein